MSSGWYRRSLTFRESLPALGAAAGAGAALGAVVFYFGRIMLQRAPLRPEGAAAAQLHPRPAAPALPAGAGREG